MKKNLLLFAVAAVSMIVTSVGEAAPKSGAFPEAKSPQDTNSQKVTQLPQSIVRLDVSKPLPTADVIAIHELISRAYLAEDSLDREALRQAVTPDFILEDSVTGKSVGRDAFGDLVLKTADFRAGSRHMALNIAVSGDGKDTAVAVHYLLAYRVFGADPKLGELPRVVGVAVVRDQLVKAQGKWRLAHRVSDQVSLLPSFVPDEQLRTKGARTIVPDEAKK
jgi:SnoaL-like domain